MESTKASFDFLPSLENLEMTMRSTVFELAITFIVD